MVASGVNSAHPEIDTLLQDSLQLPVYLSRPLATQGVGQFTPDTPLVLQGLGRLVGLGLSFLPDPESRSGQELEAPVLAESAVWKSSESELEPVLVELKDEQDWVLPTPLPELLPPASEQVEVLEKVPIDHPIDPDLENLSEPLPQTEVQASVFQSPEQNSSIEPTLDPAPVAEIEDKESTPPAIFSFASEEEQSTDNPHVEEDEVSLELDRAIHLEEDQDEVPFSMEDLFSSFETKAVDSEPEQDIEILPSANDQVVISEDLHLMDDPALWPSISKSQDIVQSGSDEPGDSQQAIS